jgi:hypothetical protein
MNILIKASYADTLTQKINTTMKELLTRFHANGSVVNTKKTTVMSLHTWQNKRFLKPQIRFNNADIGYKYEKKFGFMYD